MQQLRRHSVSRIVSYLLVAVLLAPQALVYMPAQAQTGQNVPTVAIVPFQDLTGRVGPALMREATAAAALALENSRQYVVISTTDLQREMAALHLQPPLGQAEMQRLGERLHADAVLSGSLANLAVDAASGRARAELRLMLLDVSIGEFLNGATAAIETKAIPGFAGDIAAVTNEALRQVAEAAVTAMLSNVVRRGTVQLVDDLGNINLNLGTDDGLLAGNELLVMRPTWKPDIEQVIMRRIGIIRIVQVESGMSVARSVEGTMPATGDRVYRLYKPASAQQAQARDRKISQAVKVGAALALLFGLVAVATGATTATPSSLDCVLAQARPGADPVVLLSFRSTPEQLDRTWGWLVFRGRNNPDVAPLAENLIELIPGRRVSGYSDEPFEFRVVEDREVTFTFISEDDEEDGTVTASYNDEPLVRGSRYYYRIRRVITPLTRPGENPPISTGQIEPTEPDIETEPDDTVLSDPSAPCGPVTFFTPPVLSTPANGASGMPTSNIEFTWVPSTGANEYIVQVFPASDPDGRQAPILQSAIKRETEPFATIAGPFQPTTQYFWRVGARQSTDPNRPLNQLTGERAWLYSNMRSFTTAQSPPPPPGTAGVKPRVPTRHGGWWGTDRRHR